MAIDTGFCEIGIKSCSFGARVRGLRVFTRIFLRVGRDARIHTYV